MSLRPYTEQLARPVELDSGVWDEGHAERKVIPRAQGVRLPSADCGIADYLARINARNAGPSLPDAPVRPRPDPMKMLRGAARLVRSCPLPRRLRGAAPHGHPRPPPPRDSPPLPARPDVVSPA